MEKGMTLSCDQPTGDFFGHTGIDQSNSVPCFWPVLGDSRVQEGR